MKDMVGVKNNRLTGISPSFQDGKGQWHWLFACDCGKEKIVNAVNVRNGNTQSCGCAIKGHFPSKEAREKMRIAKLGRKQTKEHIEKTRKSNLKTRSASGYISPLVGRQSPLKGLKRPDLSGENNARWVADRSKLVVSEKKHLDSKYRIWMREVKNRDGWKCRIANGDCSGRLEAHHILPWRSHPELRYQINNGITLCVFHHPRKREDEVRLSPYFQDLVGKV